MKWLLVFVVFIGVSTAVLFSSNTLGSTPISRVSSPTPTITPTKKQSLLINFKETPLRISWILAQPEKVELYSNLQTQQTSDAIKLQKDCKILVNGGFYSKENSHLGLIISNFTTLSPSFQSSLFNGFLWITSQKISINSSPPFITPRLAVQSGPLLMQNNNPLLLAIKNDQPARRIVAGMINESNIIFLVVYADKSEFQGPLLQDLPEILNLFKKQTGINILSAINLDGGSASTFITDFEYLPELSMIGSYFCVK